MYYFKSHENKRYINLHGMPFWAGEQTNYCNK